MNVNPMEAMWQAAEKGVDLDELLLNLGAQPQPSAVEQAAAAQAMLETAQRVADNDGDILAALGINKAQTPEEPEPEPLQQTDDELVAAMMETERLRQLRDRAFAEELQRLEESKSAAAEQLRRLDADAALHGAMERDRFHNAVRKRKRAVEEDGEPLTQAEEEEEDVQLELKHGAPGRAAEAAAAAAVEAEAEEDGDDEDEDEKRGARKGKEEKKRGGGGNKKNDKPRYTHTHTHTY